MRLAEIAQVAKRQLSKRKVKFTNLKSRSQNRKEDASLAFSGFSSHVEI
jgi:hypothetical protein